jgi:hypothetical protein
MQQHLLEGGRSGLRDGLLAIGHCNIARSGLDPDPAFVHGYGGLLRCDLDQELGTFDGGVGKRGDDLE